FLFRLSRPCTHKPSDVMRRTHCRLAAGAARERIDSWSALAPVSGRSASRSAPIRVPRLQPRFAPLGDGPPPPPPPSLTHREIFLERFNLAATGTTLPATG